MPWTWNRYPPAMRGLPLPVRWKAIEIANAVLAEDGDEGKAIRIGIAKAKEWAQHAPRDRGFSASSTAAGSFRPPA
ncbi:MAG TPA: hypothetical protein VGD76_20800 [Ramlibacter sp.]